MECSLEYAGQSFISILAASTAFYEGWSRFYYYYVLVLRCSLIRKYFFLDLYYTQRSVLRKDVNTNKNWTFELGHSSDSGPTHIILSFQARIKTDSQLHNNSTFGQLQFSNAVCKIMSEKYHDDGKECDYDPTTTTTKLTLKSKTFLYAVPKLTYFFRL